MRMIHGPVVVLMLALDAQILYADGLLFHLPKDGTWATYHVDLTGQIGESQGETGRAKLTIHMASVGQVTEDGQPCRWIEITMEANSVEADKVNGRNMREHVKLICKALVPEKFSRQRGNAHGPFGPCMASSGRAERRQAERPQGRDGFG
jgi:hypothetical protein